MDEESKGLLLEIIKRIDGMEQRFDGMEQRFDGMEQRFDGMEQRFDQMDERFERMEKRQDATDSRIDGMEQRFEKRFDRVEMMIQTENQMTRQAILELSEKTHHQYLELKSEINHLGKRVDEHDDILRLLKDRILIQEDSTEYDPD